MPLTQTEKDLQGFAYSKVAILMKDTAQSFEIAGLSGANSLVCLGAVFMKVATQIAVTIGAPKDEFLARVSETFDDATNDERKDR
jgi:hypothetical protein